MKEARFNIGDRVITEVGVGTVMAAYARNGGWAYPVELEDRGHSVLFFEEELEPERKEFSMDIKIDIAENVVIASLYEVVGPNMRPIAKGHGHIIHEGEIGIAQAASYATNRLWKKIGGFAK